jgi:hypothetical protein
MTSDLNASSREGLNAIQFPHDLVVRSRLVALNVVRGDWDFVSVIDRVLAVINGRSSSIV